MDLDNLIQLVGIAAGFLDGDDVTQENAVDALTDLRNKLVGVVPVLLGDTPANVLRKMSQFDAEVTSAYYRKVFDLTGDDHLARELTLAYPNRMSAGLQQLSDKLQVKFS